MADAQAPLSSGVLCPQDERTPLGRAPIAQEGMFMKRDCGTSFSHRSVSFGQSWGSPWGDTEFGKATSVPAQCLTGSSLDPHEKSWPQKNNQQQTMNPWGQGNKTILALRLPTLFQFIYAFYSNPCSSWFLCHWSVCRLPEHPSPSSLHIPYKSSQGLQLLFTAWKRLGDSHDLFSCATSPSSLLICQISFSPTYLHDQYYLNFSCFLLPVGCRG